MTMTYQALEKSFCTTEQVYDKLTGKLISSAHSTPIHTSQELRILTITYFFCFACGVQGNSLQIISQQEGVNIREAERIAEGITGQSGSQLRGKHLSGGRLPKKQRHSVGSGTSGAIRRSREA